MTTYEAHPVANLFPMLAEDELAELAGSIKQRGLDHPVILDAEGRVLDGRNRLAACKLAGVEPRFENYEGDDADDYALRSGITRRHLTTGARAMIAARAERLGSKSATDEEDDKVNKHRIYEARLVLDWAPAIADAVIAGVKPLSAAVDEARAAKRDAEALQAKLDRLRNSASDLLAHVEEERMDVDDAIAALEAREEKAIEEAAQQRTEEQERERKRADEQRDARALLTRIVDLAAPKSMSNGFVNSWVEQLGGPDDELKDLIKRAEQAAQVLLDLTEGIKK